MPDDLFSQNVPDRTGMAAIQKERTRLRGVDDQKTAIRVDIGIGLRKQMHAGGAGDEAQQLRGQTGNANKERRPIWGSAESDGGGAVSVGRQHFLGPCVGRGKEGLKRSLDPEFLCQP